MLHFIGCSVASVFVLMTGYAGYPYLAVFFLTIGVGITGINAAGYAVNILDIAPKYAGVIMGVTNVFGAAPGFISPQVVGFVTANKTAAEWRIVFWITFIMYIVGIILFGLLVSGDKQPWATDDSEDQEKDAEKGNEEKEEEKGKKDEQEAEKKDDDEKPEEKADEEKKDDDKPAEGEEEKKE